MAVPLLRAFGPTEPYRLADRRLLALLYLMGIFLGYAQVQAINTLPFAQLSFNMSDTDIERLFIITRLGALGGIIFAGFADRWGRRSPLIFTYTLFLLTTGLTAFSVSGPFYSIQIVARMSGAAALMLATVLLAEQMRSQNRAWAMGLFATAVSLGGGVGLLALPIARLGPETWRWLFTFAVIGLLFYPIFSSRLGESPVYNSLQASRWQTIQLFFGPSAGRFWLLSVYSFSLSAFSAVAVSYSLERMINDLGTSSTQATAMTLVGGALGGLGYLWGGRRADSVGRKPILMLGMALFLAGGIALYWVSNPILLFLTIGVSAFGGAIVLAASAVQRTELFPTPIRATAVQWVYSMAVLGSIVGLWLVSMGMERWDLTIAVSFSGGWVVLAVTAQIWVPESAGAEMTASQT